MLDLNLDSLFEEYLDKNVAIVLIENFSSENGKIYLKAKIQNKIISFEKTSRPKDSFKNDIPLAKEDPVTADAKVDSSDFATLLSKITGNFPEPIFFAPSLLHAFSAANFPISLALLKLSEKRFTDIS